MREEQFKAWLKETGKSDGTISSQMSKVRKLDRYFGDLDAHIRSGTIEDIKTQLSNPDSIPLELGIGDRQHLPTSLRYYLKFASGETDVTRMSQADKIRQFVIESYVKPARQRGEEEVTITSRDVHKAMGLSNAFPAICAVIEARAFAAQAHVKLLKRHSPIDSDKPSSTISYLFALENAVLPELDRANLDRLKTRFLDKYPDFETSGAFTGNSSYHPDEDNYKRALVERAAAILNTDDEDHEKIGTELLELLAGRGGLPSNLIDWRAQKAVDNAREANPGLIENAAYSLVREENAVDGTMSFVGTIWPVLRGDLPSNPYAESRMVPTMLRALVDPEGMLGVRSTPTDNAYRMLFGRPVFANSPLARSELLNVNGMARQIFRIMADEWQWQPRDLWDVQGFIWVTCQEKLPDVSIEDDEDLLKRFDHNTDLRDARERWSAEENSAFCLMARVLHDAGLDWYHTNIPQTRFGRKSEMNKDAEGTLGSFQIRKDHAFIQFSHQHELVDLAGKFPLNSDGAEKFMSAVATAKANLAQWLPNQPDRPGKWPDEYIVNQEHHDEDSSEMKPTNLILYGPPGTGKTYKTMELAVQLCGEPIPHERSDLRDIYDKLTADRRIAMVTFHQTFSYEDFVEGLRPPVSGVDADEQDHDQENSTGLRLTVHDGLFKDIAERARLDAGEGGIEKRANRDRIMFKIALGRKNSEPERHQIEDGLSQGFIHLGWGGKIDWSDERFDEFEEIRREWNSQVDPEATGKDANIEMMYTFRSLMQIGDYVVLGSGRDEFLGIGQVTGDYYYDENAEYHPHRRKVEWLCKSSDGEQRERIYPNHFRQHSTYRLNQKLIDWDEVDALITGKSIVQVAGSGRSHVLIIDEINRANISKVFGELITLIEPDKRLGMSNALKVRLPYSKREFGVPANLHIVGTMNTADRSIALLDTALRRRFHFEELAPEPDRLKVVDGIDLPAVLRTINSRIEYLLDRDHAIGHAFFMEAGAKDRAAIDDTMRFKIIPLLQEYFFEDWSRIHAVLGDGFVSCRKIDAPPFLADNYAVDERLSWSILNPFTVDCYNRLVSRKEVTNTETHSDDPNE